MKEIGGYFELDEYRLPMMHDGAIALNCGRNALAYLLTARSIQTVYLPYFLCASVGNVCRKYGVSVRYYRIGTDFRPIAFDLPKNAWLYLVNYYGQLSEEEIRHYADRYQRIIVDNAQAYFQPPADGVDTLYSCRKYFGVADGAFLYTDRIVDTELPLDCSAERLHFVLGRFEGRASDFYAEASANNKQFADEPIKKMSALTRNLLHGIDYEAVREKRNQNYAMLQAAFQDVNQLQLTAPQAPFMYPLLIPNGRQYRKGLAEKQIYIPTLWPDVFDLCAETDTEYRLSADILPLPVDQRYGSDDMKRMIEELRKQLR